MKVFVDTNILLDVVCERENFYENSLYILKLCESRIIKGSISALTIPNMIYTLHNKLSHDILSHLIYTIDKIFCVADLRFKDIKTIINQKYIDFEDALQIECAKKNKCDVIITRDKKHYANCDIEAIAPAEFLEKYITNYTLRHKRVKM